MALNLDHKELLATKAPKKKEATPWNKLAKFGSPNIRRFDPEKRDNRMLRFKIYIIKQQSGLDQQS